MAVRPDYDTTQGPLSNIRNHEDLLRYIGELQDEALRTAFTGNLLGLATPETSREISEITASLAETTGRLLGIVRPAELT